MIIKVLGTGCAKCKSLEANARQAVAEMGITAEVVKVQDMKDIMAFGVLRTPALVVDEKVVVYGKVPTVEEVKAFLKQDCIGSISRMCYDISSKEAAE